MKKQFKIILYIFLAVVVLAVLILPKVLSSGSVKKGSGRPENNAVLSISAHIIKPEILENNVNTTGTILANEEVELRSEISGKIVKILFREGSSVNKGELLVKINDEELKAQLERARYRLKLLQDREYRQRILLEREAISREDYDVSLNELNVAKSEIDLVNAQLNKTELRAPFSGRIGLKSVSEGSFVTNSTVIVTLQNINPVKIDFSIPEKYSLQVQKGDRVHFSITGSDEVFSGEIYAIEPKIDPVTRTLKIRAVYHNINGKILPGSFANINLVLRKINDAVMVPTQSVIPELKGQKIFIFKNGIAIPVNIETGLRKAEIIQVTKGLSVGDTVITSGILQIKPNMPVKISKFN